MPGKYRPLADYLAGQAPEVATVTLTFPEIEQIIGWQLPPSAETRSWWVNVPSLVHAHAWLSAGWMVVDRALRPRPSRVTFGRQSGEAVESSIWPRDRTRQAATAGFGGRSAGPHSGR